MAFLENDVWHLLALFQRELLLFAGVFFLIGALDDFALDLYWMWLRFTGRGGALRLDTRGFAEKKLRGQAAVFIPAWNESGVLGDTIAHAFRVWRHSDMRIYVGCYRNDPATIEAVLRAAPGDPRLRLVIHDRDGPSTKADCLNRLYQALRDDEARTGEAARMVVFHDAEDMVDHAALAILDDALEHADFVQLPVLPLPQSGSRFLGGHYCEEFAESHGKALVVRDALGAAIPAAGVGFALRREQLDGLAQEAPHRLPFAQDSLTEDYELGLSVAARGGRCRFLRARHRDGSLVATSAYFPSRLEDVVKQKTRWVHGIAFQGWDRLGWASNPTEFWMRLRDRRGPFAALVLLCGYLLIALATFGWAASMVGFGVPIELDPLMKLLLAANFFAFVWRALFRFGFTAREYGIAEGIMAVLRIPIANMIAIMAGRRALMAYVRVLAGRAVVWDKTPHQAHPTKFDAEELFA